MIGLDTNVLVRYLTQDDNLQAPLATSLMDDVASNDNPAFIGLVVLAETSWVLLRSYAIPREALLGMIEHLLASRAVVIEARDVVAGALAISQRTGCGFPDALISASAIAAGCDRVMTFDRGALKAGMTLLDG
jgi:predicted nucleic-acid-binding protein